MIVTIPLQARIVKRMAMLKRNALQSGDERIKLTNEILSGMRVIKYYGVYLFVLILLNFQFSLGK